jgi:hypothetical protein
VGAFLGTAVGLLLAWRRRVTVIQRQSSVSA